MTTPPTTTPAREKTSAAASLTAMQCELRAVFRDRPGNRALAEALARIGQRLGAAYAVVHTRLGVHVLSEEWNSEDSNIDSESRGRINQALWESVSTEEARCVRMQPRPDSPLLLTIVMYDNGAEPSGGAAIVVPPCDRSRILQLMAQLEGILGYVSLLFDRGETNERTTAERSQPRTTEEADHPLRLAYAMLGELQTRYGLDLSAVGFVHRDRVQIAAISGLDDLRPANPGVQVIRAAMEECLDLGTPIVFTTKHADREQQDLRLHAQWSQHAGGNTVATVPLKVMGETVAVIAMSQGGGTRLTREQVVLIQEELSGYAPLVPLSIAANRSLTRHLLDAICGSLRSIRRHNPVRVAAAAVAAIALVGWLLFGSLRYTFTVPCTVRATERRTIACPRAGVLAELFVRPGDRVQAGQLLAAIDASDDFLQRAELTAEIESLAAMIDQAIGERDAGQVRVHSARKRSLEAQLAIVDASIAQAQIRAPHDALILTGDLRERLGSRLELGVPLFELARYDRAAVELRIPERFVLAANQAVSAEFASAAAPEVTYELDDLTIAPASTVVDGGNVFLGEAAGDFDLGRLPPGMEGTARIDAGERSAWWVLTHRITDWLHLNFWL